MRNLLTSSQVVACDNLLLTMAVTTIFIYTLWPKGRKAEQSCVNAKLVPNK